MQDQVRETPLDRGRLDLASVVQRFVDGLPNHLSQLGDFVRSANRPRIKAKAHEIKGAAASFGYPGLGDLASALEKSAEHDTDERLLERFHEMRIAAKQVARSSSTLSFL